MKEGVDQDVVHSTYYITKQPLAHVIKLVMCPLLILLTDVVFLRVLLLHR